MVIIGYGVAALVVIAILIVVNVRAANRSGSAKQTHAESRDDTKENVAPSSGESRPAGLSEAEAKRDVPEPPGKPAASAKADAADRTNDQSFRQGLRQMRSGAAESREPSSKMSDSEYRRAMQALRKTESNKE